MLLSVTIVQGFQQQIRNKIIGFGGHIQISNFQTTDGFEVIPISTEQDFYPDLDTLPEVKNIQVYANQAGILKANSEILGVVMKGISTDFNWEFFSQNLVSGETLTFHPDKKSNDVLISESIANKMHLKIGDRFAVYFVQNKKPRPRKFTVKGIYNTDLEEFDKLYIIGDIRHIQKLNKWQINQVGGFEVNLNKFEDLDKMDDFIYNNIPFEYKSTTIIHKNQNLFGWLALQDVNVLIIIGLMILVCGINMASALLILILDRTRMIGLLQTMGATNTSVRKIFLYIATYLLIVGLFWGNLLGIGLALLQQEFGLVSLSPETYFISQVPIHLSITSILTLNFSTLALCIVMLLAPTYVITRIATVDAIKLD